MEAALYDEGQTGPQQRYPRRAPHQRVNMAVTSRSRHDELTPPKPRYPVGGEILGEPHTGVAAIRGNATRPSQ